MAGELAEGPAPEPRDGEVLARTLFLSLDPYMRGRISDAKSYAAAVPVGGVIVGRSVGRVVAARAPGFAAGDLAIQEAARHAFGLAARPKPAELQAMAEAWRPWRGVAARLLWADYALLKRREGINA